MHQNMLHCSTQELKSSSKTQKIEHMVYEAVGQAPNRTSKAAGEQTYYMMAHQPRAREGGGQWNDVALHISNSVTFYRHSYCWGSVLRLQFYKNQHINKQTNN